MKYKNVVITGGGIGGIVTANHLAKLLPPEVEITLIEKNEIHSFPASYLWLMVNQRKPQLTRVSDNTITWSDSYDKVLNDIFAVQNEIAQKVVDQLGGSFANNQIKKEIHPTDNLAAYDFYLQGLAYYKCGNTIKAEVQNSINMCRKAIALDPKFASAYALLSKDLMSMYWFYFDRSEENLQEAFDNAQISFKLNPNLAEAHLALGYYYYWGKLNYSKAIEGFSKALKIQPNNAEAFAATGYVYRRMGNFSSVKNFV